MKYYHILLILLVLPIVIAEDVTITLYRAEENEITSQHTFTPSKPIVNLTFNGDKAVGAIEVMLSAPRCSIYRCTSTFFGACSNHRDVPFECGPKRVLVNGINHSLAKSWNERVPDELHETPSEDVYSHEYDIPLITEGIHVEWLGDIYRLYDHTDEVWRNIAPPFGFVLKHTKWIGGDYVQVDRNILTFRGDNSIPLRDSDGTSLSVEKLIGVQNYDGEVTVASNNPKVIVWIGENNPPNAKSTSNFRKVVMGCLDLDVNGKCDYEDELECGANNDWYKGHCCGLADYPDCTYYSDKKAFCGRESPDPDGKWNWAALDEPAKIVKLHDCPGTEIVSTGQILLYCGGDPSAELAASGTPHQALSMSEIEGHHFVCVDDSIHECGGASGFNPGAALTGASILYNGATHYCTSDGKWMTDLDSDQESCEAAGFAWTGTRCCGEDLQETYEDVNGMLGGCLLGVPVMSGEFVPNTNNSRANHKGRFVSCEPSLPVGSSNIAAGIYGPCGDPLLNTTNGQNFVCMPFGEWRFTTSNETHVQTQAIWTTEHPIGCCPDDQCWNGESCQALGSYKKVNGRGFRCEQ